MKNIIQKLSLTTSKIDRRHLQILTAILVLSMLVLGAGAPGVGGGPGGW